MSNKANPFNRREFLQAGALSAVGIVLGANQQSNQEKNQNSQIRRKY